MASENSQQWLIDALYKEESTDQPTDQAELSEQEIAELASYEAMLHDVRSNLVTHSPRQEISEAIRAAAYKEAQALQQKNHPARRTPSKAGAPDTTQSLWARARKQGALQLVAVLTVSIGAAFLVRNFSSVNESAPASEPAAAVAQAEAQELEELAKEGLQLADNTPTPQPQKPVEVGNNDFEDYDYSNRRQRNKAEAPAEGLSLALREQDDSAQKDKSPGRAVSSPKKSRASSRKKSTKSVGSWESKPSPEPSDDAYNAKGNSVDDLLKAAPKTSSAPSTAGKSATSRTPKKASSMDSIFGGREDVAQEQKMASAPPASSARAGSIGNSNYADLDSLNEEEASAEPEVATKKESKSLAYNAQPQNAEAEEVQAAPVVETTSTTATKADDKVANTSLSDVEQSFARSDYDQALNDANSYLAREIGSNNERARALELKAKSLENLGRASEARAVYEKIQRDYPGYYKKENIRKKQKRKSAPQKLDSMNESMQSF